MESNEASLSTSPSSFSLSQQRHFYLAVDRLQFKMETLVDLLSMAGRLRSLPIVVSCSTRDELDAVCYALSSLSHITIDALYSDLPEAERARVFSRFRQATMRWNKQATGKHGDAGETEKEEEKSHVIVVTDVCLPLVNSGESPIYARVLVNYELPTKKETYMRRMATCLAADGIAINMVVGGEVVALKSIEESTGLLIDEMPIDIFEML
ncbi:ATP-dependent RNA helicase eIF4A isoform X1 [Capsicum annuum]|uniref:ATP-dependent RNA helicase eIF4A isoform X1 n=1 Tax=Capsicum annuum TaxID=4072 RepID=UPI0007BFD5E5|nr:ATP-dependent RNA helicase eIF4A isoform X1 [Capsicum annuum]